MIVTMAPDTILATRENIDAIVSALKPLRGGIWLATDRRTRCTWVVEAAAVHPARGSRYGLVTPASGLVTVSDRDGGAVFMIDYNDSVMWLERGETLVVQEGRFNGAEIVLQRIDDLDAPLMSAEALNRRMATGEIVTVIRMPNGRYIEVPECLLPTGNIEIDDALMDVEADLRDCVQFSSGNGSTSAMLESMERRLIDLAGRTDLRSFIWLAALRNSIGRLLRSSHVA